MTTPIDESWDFFSLFHKNQLLKSELNKFPEIPRVTYKVLSNKSVFVFEKLIEKAKDISIKDLKSNISSLLTQAEATPLEAVSLWNIRPYPFELVANEESGFDIYHCKFYVKVKSFTDKQKAEETLAEMLVGNPAEVFSPDFEFDGQGFKLTEKDLGLFKLPSAPFMEFAPVDDSKEFKLLTKIDFREGFPLITPDILRDFKELEKTWNMTKAALKQSNFNDGETLFNKLGTLNLGRQPKDGSSNLTNPSPNLFLELYPELEPYNISEMPSLYQAYVRDCSERLPAPVIRDANFIAYLVGLSEKLEISTDSIEFLSFSLRTKESLKDALTLHKYLLEYNKALFLATGRIYEALSFLKEHSEKENKLEGSPIVLLMEVLSNGRNQNHLT